MVPNLVQVSKSQLQTLQRINSLLSHGIDSLPHHFHVGSKSSKHVGTWVAAHYQYEMTSYEVGLDMIDELGSSFSLKNVGTLRWYWRDWCSLEMDTSRIWKYMLHHWLSLELFLLIASRVHSERRHVRVLSEWSADRSRQMPGKYLMTLAWVEYEEVAKPSSRDGRV